MARGVEPVVRDDRARRPRPRYARRGFDRTLRGSVETSRSGDERSKHEGTRGREIFFCFSSVDVLVSLGTSWWG